MNNGFKIIGLSIRTTSKNNKAQEDIGKLWSAFFKDHIQEQIPNKVSNDILAIYTDYESDYTEEYTTIIGLQVSSLTTIPEGMLGRELEPAYFHKYTAKGLLPNAIIATWQEICAEDQKLDRAYTYDFEVYGERAWKDADSEVDIYIAVNKPT